MTYPRCIVPGQTVLLTRRTLRRHHLFRPDKQMNQLFVYALATLAKKWKIDVHVPMLMSTHPHIVLTDTLGQLPCFMRDFHRILSLGTKALRGWEGSTFDNEKSSGVVLETAEAVVDKMAYCIANPVAAGLVRRAREWPGVTLRPRELGQKQWVVRRPDYFFNPNSTSWPKEVTLVSTVPEVLLREHTEEQVRQKLEEQVALHEQNAHEEIVREGRGFLGAKKILCSSPFKRAKTPEAIRSRNPQFAIGPTAQSREALARALAKLRAFRSTYQQAMQRWKLGFRDVLFPEGTWWMRVFHRVHTEHIGLT